MSHKNPKKLRGRPLESPLPRDETITIRLNKAELEALQEWCWRYDRSISDTVRDLMMVHSIIPDCPTR